MAPPFPLSSIRPLVWKLKARQSLHSQYKDRYFFLFGVHETFSISFRIMADDSNKWPNESPSLSPVNLKMREKFPPTHTKNLSFLGLHLFVYLFTYLTCMEKVFTRLKNEFLGCRAISEQQTSEARISSITLTFLFQKAQL